MGEPKKSTTEPHASLNESNPAVVFPFRANRLAAENGPENDLIPDRFASTARIGHLDRVDEVEMHVNEINDTDNAEQHRQAWGHE